MECEGREQDKYRRNGTRAGITNIQRERGKVHWIRREQMLILLACVYRPQRCVLFYYFCVVVCITLEMIDTAVGIIILCLLSVFSFLLKDKSDEHFMTHETKLHTKH